MLWTSLIIIFFVLDGLLVFWFFTGRVCFAVIFKTSDGHFFQPGYFKSYGALRSFFKYWHFFSWRIFPLGKYKRYNIEFDYSMDTNFFTGRFKNRRHLVVTLFYDTVLTAHSFKDSAGNLCGSYQVFGYNGVPPDSDSLPFLNQIFTGTDLLTPVVKEYFYGKD